MIEYPFLSNAYSFFFVAVFSEEICFCLMCILKSDNLQYNTLGQWDNRLIDQVSDVPSIKIRQSKINSRSVAGPMGQMNRRPSV